MQGISQLNLNLDCKPTNPLCGHVTSVKQQILKMGLQSRVPKLCLLYARPFDYTLPVTSSTLSGCLLPRMSIQIHRSIKPNQNFSSMHHVSHLNSLKHVQLLDTFGEKAHATILSEGHNLLSQCILTISVKTSIY